MWKQQNLTKENSNASNANNNTRGEDISVAIFGHGMAFKCLLRGILGFQPQHSYKIHLDNTAITELGISLSYYYYSILIVIMLTTITNSNNDSDNDNDNIRRELLFIWILIYLLHLTGLFFSSSLYYCIR